MKKTEIVTKILQRGTLVVFFLLRGMRGKKGCEPLLSILRLNFLYQIFSWNPSLKTDDPVKSKKKPFANAKLNLKTSLLNLYVLCELSTYMDWFLRLLFFI